MDLFDLTGKVALVTGSTRGMGETAAKALAKAGADVAVCGRNPADLKRVSAEIRAMGRKSAGFVLDVLSKEKVTEGDCRGTRATSVASIYSLIMPVPTIGFQSLNILRRCGI